MDKDLVVKIFAPTMGRDGEPRGADKGQIGTGYPVSKDLILTSRHVVEPERRDFAHPLLVCWDKFPDENSNDGWQEVREVVWRGAGELDAALIRCSRPPEGEKRYWGLVVNKMPPQGACWHSRGFPRATRIQNLNHGDCSGTVESMGNDDYFELNVENPPKNREMWKGASGMPVFISYQIYGVVKEVPDNFEGRKLHAIPTWKMYQDEEFRKLLEQDRRKQFLIKTAKRIEAVLLEDGASDTRRLLTVELNTEVIGNDRAEAEAIVSKVLTGVSVNEFFGSVRKVRRQLLEDNDRTGMDLIARMTECVLPLLVDPETVEMVHLKKSDIDIGLISLPVCSCSVAELVMAGVDRRPASYCAFDENNTAWDDLHGTNELPELPEGGRNSSVNQTAMDFRNQLYDHFNADVHDRFQDSMNICLRQRFASGSLGAVVVKKGKEKDIDEYINVVLETESLDNNRSYYFVFRTSDDESRKGVQRLTIRNLKERYPLIVFLELRDDKESILAELRMYSSLKNILQV